ncbi:unnamed protein product [Psylliodes chrysocephalus]|uniref:Uncharacterized protein n=1 Tax=Psylliodes chrysocephalus TaxID=3402493 RepID=A0A9P0CR04_9CUCU|nr:unnamed protein product [Psylliodes chrysocephala]
MATITNLGYHFLTVGASSSTPQCDVRRPDALFPNRQCFHEPLLKIYFQWCPMKCFNKLSSDEKILILNKLCQLETKDEQDIYLQGFIERRSVARKRARNPGGNSKSNTYFHFVPLNHQRVKVCLAAFLNLHAARVKRVKRLKLLLESNTTPCDNRGKSVKSNCLQNLKFDVFVNT